MDADRLTVPALIRQRVETDPDARFLVTDDAAITYLELDRATAQAAARLIRAGVAKGTRVGTHRGNLVSNSRCQRHSQLGMDYIIDCNVREETSA